MTTLFKRLIYEHTGRLAKHYAHAIKRVKATGPLGGSQIEISLVYGSNSVKKQKKNLNRPIPLDSVVRN